MTSEELREAGIIEMPTCTSLPSLWASPNPVAFPEGPGSVQLTIFLLQLRIQALCKAADTEAT